MILHIFNLPISFQVTGLFGLVTRLMTGTCAGLCKKQKRVNRFLELKICGIFKLLNDTIRFPTVSTNFWNQCIWLDVRLLPGHGQSLYYVLILTNSAPIIRVDNTIGNLTHTNTHPHPTTPPHTHTQQTKQHKQKNKHKNKNKK